MNTTHSHTGSQRDDMCEICPAGQGYLPGCGAFAVPYVVSQGKDPKRYTPEKALEYGTLYPDLNLPFHLKVNPGEVAETPLNQLRALEFVILELGLYLDTHPFDREAFALFQDYVEQSKAAQERYKKTCGPLCLSDAAEGGSFQWWEGPWPWQYPGEEG